MENLDQADLAAQAVMAALDFNSPPQVRHNAVLLLDSIKSGDVHALGRTALALVRPTYSSEVRHYGIKLLQHLVRLRWTELSAEERATFSHTVIDMISDIANSNEQWDIKSQTASLVAEVVRMAGCDFWQHLLPVLQSLSAQSPLHAELVAMVLRWFPEDVTVHNEDLEGDRRRQLLRGLTDSLPIVLPTLHQLIFSNLGAAQQAWGQGVIQLYKQHAVAVQAALNAANAYAEWAPIPELGTSGLINICGQLLGIELFRQNACEFFKLICPRKRPSDDSASEFDSNMVLVFDILMLVGRSLVMVGTNEIKANIEFAQSICACLVLLGCNNLSCICCDTERLASYLQLMHVYLTHLKFVLHIEALPLWLLLLRELGSVSKVTESQGDGGKIKASSISAFQDKGKSAMAEKIVSELCSKILNTTYERLLKTSFGAQADCLVERWSDEFESKCSYSQYRSKLLELIRLIAAQQPVNTASVISERVGQLVKLVTFPDLSVLEDTQLSLEASVSGIFDGGSKHGNNLDPHLQMTLCNFFEGTLQKLLDLNWKEPVFLEIHGRFLVSMGPYLKHFDAKLWATVDKLFQLLRSLPIIPKSQEQGPIQLNRIRLQVCASFIRIAKEADKKLVQYMEKFYKTMNRLQTEGHLLQSERIVLGEALLVMSSGAGLETQGAVLNMLVEPLQSFWSLEEWQNKYFSDPKGLVSLLTRGPTTSENELMWNIYHSVNFFERALKRSGYTKLARGISPEQSSGNNDTPVHPMAYHIPWIILPLLKILRCIHALPFQELPEILQAALVIIPAEQNALLGETAQKPKGVDGNIEFNVSTDSNCHEIHNWIKGVRDSGYNVMGLAMGIENSLFNCIEAETFYLSLLESLQTMDFRHIRLLIHLVIIPLVKTCPIPYRENWLAKVLSSVLGHCEVCLSISWDCLQKEGRAKVPDRFADSSRLGIKVEVMEEKLLRDLTRECSILLSTLASTIVNKDLPTLEQVGQVGKTTVQDPADAEKISSETMIGFLIKHQAAALSALNICKSIFTWPDSEAVPKASAFCGSIIAFSLAIQHFELQRFLSKEIFGALIHGLTLKSNATVHADLVGISREILVHFYDKHSSTKEVLMSLPFLTQEALAAFESAMARATSSKEQKSVIKALLMTAGGSHMRALISTQKSSNTITNISTSRSVPQQDETNSEGDTIGLASLS